MYRWKTEVRENRRKNPKLFFSSRPFNRNFLSQLWRRSRSQQRPVAPVHIGLEDKFGWTPPTDCPPSCCSRNRHRNTHAAVNHRVDRVCERTFSPLDIQRPTGEHAINICRLWCCFCEIYLVPPCGIFIQIVKLTLCLCSGVNMKHFEEL